MGTRVIRAHKLALDLRPAEQKLYLRSCEGRQKAYNFGLALVKDILGLDRCADGLRAGDGGDKDGTVVTDSVASVASGSAKADTQGNVPASGGQPYRWLDRFGLIRVFTKAKPTLPWTNGVGSRVFEYAFEDLINSLSAFFGAREKRAGGVSSRKVGFPGFVPIRDADSFTTRGAIKITSDTRTEGAKSNKDRHKPGLRHEGCDSGACPLPHRTRGTMTLPNLPPVRVCGSTRRLLRELDQYNGDIREVTVSRKNGRWSASVVVERDARAELPTLPEIMKAKRKGMDAGLTTYITLSDGARIKNPRFLRSVSRRARHFAMAVGRSQRIRMVVFYTTGIMPPKSNRQVVKESKSASCQHKTANRRDTFVKQVAAKLIPSNRVLGVESLAIANMLLNHCLARSIADAGWRKLFATLESRAEDNGALIVAVNRFFASSQTCSVCGVKNPAVKSLKVRFWTCPACGAMHQRDLNAAVNMIPTDEKLVAAYTERMERIAAHERSKTKISDRAKKAAATNTSNAQDRQAKAERRAAEKAIQAASAAPALSTTSTPIPSRTPVVPGSRSVDPIPGETTNNSAWRPGKTGLAARVATTSESPRRQEARTDASRSRTSYLGGSPPG